MTHVSASLFQQAFRGREDDGSETGATWIAATNTDWTQAADQAFRVRIVIEEVAGGLADNKNFLPQFSVNGGGFQDVTDTTPVRFQASDFVASGSSTTQQISSGDFVPGEFLADGESDGVSLDGELTEMEYGLWLDSEQLSDGDTVQIRASDDGDALDDYINTPTITVSVEAATIDGTGASTASAQTGSGEGTVTPATQEIDGTGSSAASAQTGAGTGVREVSGGGLSVATDQTASGSGARQISGTGSSVASTQTANGQGSVTEASDDITGSGASVSAAQLGTGSGVRQSNGSGSGVATAQTSAGTGVRESQGTGASLATAQTGSGSAGQVDQTDDVSGTGGSVAARQTSTGVGLRVIDGSGSSTASAQAGTGSGDSTVQPTGAGASVASRQTATGIGLRVITGTGQSVAQAQTGVGFEGQRSRRGQAAVGDRASAVQSRDSRTFAQMAPPNRSLSSATPSGTRTHRAEEVA